jgi:hypothetical protein
MSAPASSRISFRQDGGQSARFPLLDGVPLLGDPNVVFLDPVGHTGVISFDYDQSMLEARIDSSLTLLRRDGGGANLDAIVGFSHLRLGQDFRHRILDGIRNCRYFLALLSDEANCREEAFVFDEWQEANARRKAMNREFLFPVIVEAKYEPERYTARPVRDGDWARLDFCHAPDGVRGDSRRKGDADRIGEMAPAAGAKPFRETVLEIVEFDLDGLCALSLQHVRRFPPVPTTLISPAASQNSSCAGKSAKRVFALDDPRIHQENPCKGWMAGHRLAKATPFFKRLCPAMTPEMIAPT